MLLQKGEIMRVNLIVKPRKNKYLANYEYYLAKHISKKEDVEVISMYMSIPEIMTRLYYPFYVRHKVDDGIKHITTPGLAHILNFIDCKNSIVTCHDVTPLFLDYFTYLNRISFKYAIKGITKAERIIVDSESTKKDISKYLRCPEDKIRVVYLGVDHSRYRLYKNIKEIRSGVKERYKIEDSKKILLYVGAEQPRKNLTTLIKAFYKLKMVMPEIKFIKVGPPWWGGARRKLMKLISQLDLQNDVIFIDFVPEEELPLFYNVADLFVFPSYYEGFGLPPLEAMACGCPVITTNKSSIPEIVGDAAIKLDDPFDVELLSKTMEEVLANEGLRKEMIKAGLNQAKMFSWEKYADDVYGIYKQVYEK